MSNIQKINYILYIFMIFMILTIQIEFVFQYIEE